MAERIARIFEALMRLLLPGPGRHRGADERPAVRHQEVPTFTLPRVPAHGPVLVRGEDAALIRPYVLTLEERQERQLQRGRRRVLRLAGHGVDAGPRWIHGVEVVG
ncbi:hypothetical protein ACTPOK_16660 [Streptomyces inhibens]|uniref:hypothetical protein n=1 Tax=Streptomyces inhibens TaxID=2293571 RepID=UPI00402AC9A0